MRKQIEGEQEAVEKELAAAQASAAKQKHELSKVGFQHVVSPPPLRVLDTCPVL